MSTAFLDKITPYRLAVESGLNRWITAEVPVELQQLIRDGIWPGRRIRPSLFLYLATSVEEVDKKLSDIAVGIELVHRASIIADDILDFDETRRQRPTFHLQQGKDTAFILPYFLFGHAISSAYRGNVEAGNVLASAGSEMSAGELADVRWSLWKKEPITLYMEIALKKTRSLFVAICTLAASLGEEDADNATATHMGEIMGNLYQMTNDLRDTIQKDVRDERKKFYRIPFNLMLAISLQNGLVRRKEIDPFIGQAMEPESYENIRSKIITPQTIAASEMLIEQEIAQFEDIKNFLPKRWTGIFKDFVEALHSPAYWDHSKLSEAGYKD